jgi:cystathionine beta-lyase
MDDRTSLIRETTRRTEGRRTVNPPIERGTTILNARAKDLRDASLGYTYGISGHAVHRALRDHMNVLEHAVETVLAPTGLAAVTIAILAVVSAGDDIIATDAVYWPTRLFGKQFLDRYGVTIRYAAPRASAEEVLAMATERTKLIVMESPGSITFEIQDVPGIAKLAKARGITTMIDNTWSAGLYFRPLDHGVDISVQALSKYAGGHSDVFAGSISVNDKKLAEKIEDTFDLLGFHVSSEDAYLTLRGLRTLPTRLAEHGRNGLEVATWLEQQPEVARVLYAPLTSSPDHALWKRDFTGANGLMGIELVPGSTSDAEAFIDALELFGVGFSWGGFESLATNEDVSVRRRVLPNEAQGPLIRIHIGLEAPADLMADLRKGLDVYAGLVR